MRRSAFVLAAAAAALVPLTASASAASADTPLAVINCWQPGSTSGISWTVTLTADQPSGTLEFPDDPAEIACHENADGVTIDTLTDVTFTDPFVHYGQSGAALVAPWNHVFASPTAGYITAITFTVRL